MKKQLPWDGGGVLLGVTVGYIVGKAAGEGILAGCVSGVLTYTGLQILFLRFNIITALLGTLERLLSFERIMGKEIDATIRNAVSLKRKRNTLLGCILEAIKKMVVEQSVIIYQTPSEYLKKLEELCSRSNVSLYGTCTVRPKFFASAYDKPAGERTRESKRRQAYLKLILEAPAAVKCRIVILEKDEIKGILEDCVKNIVDYNVNSFEDLKSNKQFLDIPEIEWFVITANGNNYITHGIPKPNKQTVRLFWGEDTSARNARVHNKLVINEHRKIPRIEEYAVFDGEVVIKYNYVDEWNNGVLFTAWGHERDMIKHYNCPFEEILNNPNNLETKLYKSFYELVYNYPWNSIDTMIFDNSLINNIINNKKPNEIYNQIIEWLINKQIKFNAEYVQDF